MTLKRNKDILLSTCYYCIAITGSLDTATKNRFAVQASVLWHREISACQRPARSIVSATDDDDDGDRASVKAPCAHRTRIARHTHLHAHTLRANPVFRMPRVALAWLAHNRFFCCASACASACTCVHMCVVCVCVWYWAACVCITEWPGITRANGTKPIWFKNQMSSHVYKWKCTSPRH